jgi:hypothetical protein
MRVRMRGRQASGPLTAARVAQTRSSELVAGQDLRGIDPTKPCIRINRGRPPRERTAVKVRDCFRSLRQLEACYAREWRGEAASLCPNIVRLRYWNCQGAGAGAGRDLQRSSV